MSLATRSIQGSALSGAALTCSPARAISTASPVVLSATVLPPAFGPEITRAVPRTSRMSFGTQARPDSSISGWRARWRSMASPSPSDGAAASIAPAWSAAAAMTSSPAATSSESRSAWASSAT